jgi:exonuclease SbcC
MLKSIRLMNWRSHAETRLEFRAGTNLLVGIMGSGKSSVLEAVSFALFGTFPAVERRKLKMEDIIRLDKPEAKVSLEFGWDGSGFRIERSIERKRKGGTTSHAEIFKDGTLVESGTTAVTSYVEGTTSLDYDLFTRAIYSEQNNIDYFLNLDPRKRKQEIDALLGLDKFETARSNAVTVTNRIRARRQGMEETFSKEKLEELGAKEKKHKEETGAAEGRLKKASEALEKQRSGLEALSKRFEGMRKKRDMFESLSKDSLRLGGQQDSLRKELESAALDETGYEGKKKELSKLSEEKEKLTASARDMEQENARLSKEAGSIEAKLKAGAEARKGLGELGKTLSETLAGKTPDELAEQQKGVEGEILNMESERKSAEREVKEVSGMMERLKPGLSKCPLCSSTLTEDGISHVRVEKEALVKAKTGRIGELSKLLVAAKKRNEELRERLSRSSLLSEKTKSLEEQAKGLDELAKRKEMLESELKKVSEGKRKANESLDSLSKQAERLRLEVSSYEGILKKRKELEQVEKRLSEIKGKLASVEFEEKTFEELRAQAEDARLKLERLTSDKRSIEEQLRMGREVLRMVSEELSEMKGLEKDIRKHALLEEQLTIYKNALLETQTSLRGTLTDAINSAMNEIWPIFYPYRNYHALRLTVSERDYVFEVNDGSEWRPLESIASGGERASAALTLRVALAMVLTPRLSWLILDEPTHNLDKEAINLLSHALQFKVPEVVKQTFVITHEEGLMGSDFASSYRLTRDKEQNGETKVELA